MITIKVIKESIVEGAPARWVSPIFSHCGDSIDELTEKAENLSHVYPRVAFFKDGEFLMEYKGENNQ